MYKPASSVPKASRLAKLILVRSQQALAHFGGKTHTHIYILIYLNPRFSSYLSYTSHVSLSCASTGATSAVADVLEESNKFEEVNPEDCPVTHDEDPISSSGDEFED